MTVATRREREQHMRRETILDAGRKLFKDKGFEATTVDEIAALAELGKGTIYSYFKSKDEIYIAILETEFEVLKERMNQAIEKATTAINALSNLYETFIQYNLERRGFIEAVFVQVDQQSSVRLGDVVIGLKEKSSEWTGLVSKVLQWGIERGEFERFEVDKMAKAVIGLILGLIIQSEMGQIKEDLSNYRDTLFRLILEGIIKRHSA
jgi:AcrR family transcriptional regulator